MAKSFIDVVQDSPRTGIGIPMGVKPALEGEKHAHANVGESRSQLKIPQKTVDLAD